MKRKIFTLLTVIAIAATLFSIATVSYASEPESAYTEEKQDTGSDQNPFEALYTLSIENMDKIFSALAFLCSLILAFAYRKGLLPLIKSALSAIGGRVGSFENATREAIEKTEETVNFLSDKFAYCENTIDSLSKSIDTLLENSEASAKEGEDIERLKTIMLAQVEMLYDIFMQSSLPQYSKDEVGEKISLMKKSLADGSCDE